MTIRALRTKAVKKGGPSEDGQYGLVGFQRTNPAPSGDDVLWVAVPTGLLPHLAVSAISSIPQPEAGLEGKHPAVFEMQEVQVGADDQGRIVLTLTFDLGAKLSVLIDATQADGMSDALDILLGKSSPLPSGGKAN